MTEPSITCPRCGSTSYHPEDIRQGYCGRCNWWTSDPTLGQVEEWSAPRGPERGSWWQRLARYFGLGPATGGIDVEDGRGAGPGPLPDE